MFLAHRDFKDLLRRPACDKVLHDKAFNISKNQKYDWYQRGMASVNFTFFYKKFSVDAVTHANKSGLKSDIM